MGEPLSVVLYRAADLVRDAILPCGIGRDLEWVDSNNGQPTGQIYDDRGRLVAHDVTHADIAWIVLTRPTIGPALEALLRNLADAAAEHEAEPLDRRDDPSDIYCHDEMLAAELAHALCRDADGITG
jgi:hypothetical protein